LIGHVAGKKLHSYHPLNTQVISSKQAEFRYIANLRVQTILKLRNVKCED